MEHQWKTKKKRNRANQQREMFDHNLIEYQTWITMPEYVQSPPMPGYAPSPPLPGYASPPFTPGYASPSMLGYAPSPPIQIVASPPLPQNQGNSSPPSPTRTTTTTTMSSPKGKTRDIGPLFKAYEEYAEYTGTIVQLNLDTKTPFGIICLKKPVNNETTVKFNPEFVYSARLKVLIGDELTFNLKWIEKPERHYIAQSTRVICFIDIVQGRTFETCQSCKDPLESIIEKLEELKPEALEDVRQCPAALQFLARNCSQSSAIKLCGFACSVLSQPLGSEVKLWASLMNDKLFPSLLEPTGPLLKSGDDVVFQNRDLILKFTRIIARSPAARFLTSLLEVLVRCFSSRADLHVELLNFMVSIFRDSNPLKLGDPLSMFQWKQLPLVPTNEEVCGASALWTPGCLNSLPEVRLNKPYPSVDNYLETYYRLYRADCFMDLSKLMQPIINSNESKFDPRDIAIFDSLLLTEIQTTDSRELVYTIRCRPRSAYCIRYKNLNFGNLLALSLDGSFKEIVWATLAMSVPGSVRREFHNSRNRPDDPGLIDLNIVFCTTANGGTDAEFSAIHSLACGNPRAVLVENPVFFMAYAPVLSAILKLAQEKDFPFCEELCFCEKPPKIEPPACTPPPLPASAVPPMQSWILGRVTPAAPATPIPSLTNTPEILASSKWVLACSSESPLTFPQVTPEAADSSFSQNELKDTQVLVDLMYSQPDVFGTFDKQQKEAYLEFTTKRLSLTQGPPGTGKSYLGARIVYSLVCASVNAERRKWPGPILVMAYKNHSLDELLIDVKKLLDEKYTERKDSAYSMIARLGRNPKQDSAIARFTLENLNNNMRANREYPNSLNNQFHTAIQNAKVALGEVHRLERELTDRIVILYDEFPEIHDPFEYTYGKSERTKMLSVFDSWVKCGLFYLEQDLNNREIALKGERIKPIEPVLKSDENIDDEENEERKREEEERMASAGVTKKRKKKLMAINEHRANFNLANIAFHYSSMFPNLDDQFSILVPLPDQPQEIATILIQHLLKKHEKCTKDFKAAIEGYAGHLDALQFNRAKMNAYALTHEGDKNKRVFVVGCTITGAAIHHDTIAAIAPSALVIEEAAEIAEPALLGTLFPSLKRIVMIGDHKQLRPSVQCHDLQRTKHLDISAFERLINNGYPVVTLLCQNRMLPQLLKPVKLHYENLDTNLALVSKQLELEPWLKKPLFWWTHDVSEDESKSAGRSRLNLFEIKRSIMLITFLLGQGIPPERITFLTPYTGQLMEMRASLKRHNSQFPLLQLRQVQASSIDEFQGDENHIIILSLVRSTLSNNAPSIGFLRQVNRQIVATSRQKIALIIIGNHNTFSFCTEWKRLITLLEKEECVSKKLPLMCPRHKKPIEFDAPYLDLARGCGEACGALLECKHPCTSKCHGPAFMHEQCKETVITSFPTCSHKVKRQCGTRAPLKCREKIPVDPSCGHKILIQCHKSKTYTCTKRCEKILSCGHPCTQQCGVPCSSRACEGCIAERARIILRVLKRDANKKKKQEPASTKNTSQSLSLVSKAKLITSIESIYNDPNNPRSTTAKEWSDIVDLLLASDFFDHSISEEPCLLAVGDNALEIEGCEKLWKTIAYQLNIRIPKKWETVPHIQAVLALYESVSPGTLELVRGIIQPLVADIVRPTDEQIRDGQIGGDDEDEHSVRRVASLVKAAIRLTHDALLDFITGWNRTSSHCVHFSLFAETPISELAGKVSRKLGAESLFVLGIPALAIARKWELPLANMTPTAVLNTNSIAPYHELEKRNLYVAENHGAVFVTIDLKRAAFAVLSLAVPAAVAHCSTWEEFVDNVIKHYSEQKPGNYMPRFTKQFKAMRTALLGKLCHVKNTALQSHILRLIARAIVMYCSAREFPEKDADSIATIFRFSCDELIIKCSKESHLQTVYDIVVSAIHEHLPMVQDIVKIQAIRLACVLYTKTMTLINPEELWENDDEEDAVLKPGHAAFERKWIELDCNYDGSWDDPNETELAAQRFSTEPEPVKENPQNVFYVRVECPPNKFVEQRGKTPKNKKDIVAVKAHLDLKKIPKWNLVEGLFVVQRMRKDLENCDWPKNYFVPNAEIEEFLSVEEQEQEQEQEEQQQQQVNQSIDTPTTQNIAPETSKISSSPSPNTSPSPPTPTEVPLATSTPSPPLSSMSRTPNPPQLELCSIQKSGAPSKYLAQFENKQSSLQLQQLFQKPGFKSYYEYLKDILPHCSRIMTNQFGNHAFQLLLGYCNEKSIQEIIRSCGKELATVATNKFGVHSFYKLVSMIKNSDQICVFVDSLRPFVVALLIEKGFIGHSVIEKCIGHAAIEKCFSSLPRERMDFVYEELQKTPSNINKLAHFKEGIAGLELCINYANPHQKCLLAIAINEFPQYLKEQFGVKRLLSLLPEELPPLPPPSPTIVLPSSIKEGEIKKPTPVYSYELPTQSPTTVAEEETTTTTTTSLSPPETASVIKIRNNKLYLPPLSPSQFSPTAITTTANP